MEGDGSEREDVVGWESAGNLVSMVSKSGVGMTHITVVCAAIFLPFSL